ncbi:hypothetical protein [Streptomyces sp. NPDC051183]|uniref:hypothetical protein n=1 Tax=Streptomyces sp. NPDC051183 TaxID=3155165 RepID=UPI00342F0DD4
MTTGRWLVSSALRYLFVALAGWVAAAAVLPRGSDPFGAVFGAGMLVGLLVLPLLTGATVLVLSLLADRRFEPPDGGAARIRGG